MFSDYLERWNLRVDGPPVMTPTSGLLPVLCGDVPAMLKVAVVEEEKLGNQLMIWWHGQGAARVLAHAESAILMPRAEAEISLGDMARSGQDDQASRVMCAVLRQLHAPRIQAPPALRTLTEWFAPLGPAAQAHGGVLRAADDIASKLLAAQRDVVVLHGDIHHGNVLRFGRRDWLAIDPKGIIGERGFDYANIFCNPDEGTATTPGRLARQIGVIAHAADLEPHRLLSWVLSWAGLSAAFSIADGASARAALRIAEIAATELNA
jgi:streptomycin 6-kinase